MLSPFTTRKKKDFNEGCLVGVNITIEIDLINRVFFNLRLVPKVILKPQQNNGGIFNLS